MNQQHKRKTGPRIQDKVKTEARKHVGEDVLGEHGVRGRLNIRQHPTQCGHKDEGGMWNKSRSSAETRTKGRTMG